MKISEVLMGGISEVYFRYAAKSEVYANLSSDIPKLYAIQKTFFLRGKGMTGFQRRINLNFSKIIEKDNIVFFPLRSENELFINFNL